MRVVVYSDPSHDLWFRLVRVAGLANEIGGLAAGDLLKKPPCFYAPQRQVH